MSAIVAHPPRIKQSPAIGAALALSLALAALGLAPPAFAQEASATATSQVANRDGAALGTVDLATTPSGQVHVTIMLEGLPAGTHAIHLHETGDCSAEDFTSAGGHIAGGATHGILNPDGPHPGDMPNLHVGEDGVAEVEYFLSALEMDQMIGDEDGAAVVVHDGADDYETEPAGDSGDRIACGVLDIAG